MIVDIEQLTSTDVLGVTIFDSDGEIVAKKGTPIDAGLGATIREMRLGAVYVQDRSNRSGDKGWDPDSFKAALSEITELFKTGKTDDYTVASKWSLMDRETFERGTDIFTETIELIADRFDAYRTPVRYLARMKDFDHFSYFHSLNVAMLSGLLGAVVGLEDDALLYLVIGALFHDIGKLTTSLSILSKKERLTESDWKGIKSHPQNGIIMLKEANLPSASKMVIIQHHERIDGRGYPNARSGRDIHLLAKITSIADVYDALTSARPFCEAYPAAEIIEYLLGGGGSLFDFDIVTEFADKVVTYPVGTRVRLSTGSSGEVVRLHKNSPRRPVIRLLKQVEEKSQEIDLAETMVVTIIGGEKPVVGLIA